jgi:hypothetical protein
MGAPVTTHTGNLAIGLGLILLGIPLLIFARTVVDLIEKWNRFPWGESPGFPRGSTLGTRIIGGGFVLLGASFILFP